MSLTQIAAVDFTSRKYTTIRINQYEYQSREFYFELYDNKIRYNIPENVTIRIKICTNNGIIMLYDCEIIDNMAHIIFDDQVSAVAGKTKAQLVLIDTDEQSVVTTVPFYIQVVGAVYDEEIMSDEKFKSLEDALLTYDTSIRHLKTYEESARQSSESASESADIATEKAAETIEYYGKTKDIYDSIGQYLTVRGSVEFENLPPLSEADPGDMYNILDRFITTNEFIDGEGRECPAGTNVYAIKVKSEQDDVEDYLMWDIFSIGTASGVVGGVLQLEHLPNDRTYDGMIVEYVGEDTEQYKHSYFYECKYANSYKWSVINAPYPNWLFYTEKQDPSEGDIIYKDPYLKEQCLKDPYSGSKLSGTVVGRWISPVDNRVYISQNLYGCYKGHIDKLDWIEVLGYSILDEYYNKSEVDNKLSNKQNKLTIDTEIKDSNNPVINKAIYNALSRKANINSIPTKLSDLTNDSNFITKAVEDLTYYYTKSEVNDMVSRMSTLQIEIVEELPIEDISTTTIYFLLKSTSVEKNIYDEYIYVNNNWELIGSTNIDLSAYQTINLVRSITINGETISTVENALYALNEYIKTKQDTLIYDNAPTDNSNNMVKSGDIKIALDAKQDNLTFDEIPLSSSDNPVKSSGIYSALESKQKKLQFSILPIPTEDNLGAIYQYTGNTNSNYINGIWYKVAFNSTDGIYYYTPVNSNIEVDNVLSTTSKNPVENKVITNELNSKVNKTDLALVAKTGSYSDLEDTPDIPTSTSDLINDSGFTTFDGDYNSLDNKPIIPTTTNELTNNSGFIDNTVDNLINYYSKNNLYTKNEVDDIISAISTMNMLVVQQLPTTDISTNTIYLLPKSDVGTNNEYEEYVYISNKWELIGDTKVDLSDYITNGDLNIALSNYTTSQNLNNLLNAKQDALIVGENISINGNVISAIDTTYPVVSKTENGLVPQLPNESITDKFLRQDGVWQVPPNTTYSNRNAVQGGTDLSLVTTGEKYNWNNKADEDSLATVAKTGSYNDLKNKPTHLGHTVINENDTILIDRPRLHFTGNVSVKDDATNGETDVEILGTEDHIYDTYAEAIADINDIGEGESVYVKEGSSDDLKDRVENIETVLPDKQDKTDNGIKTTAKTVVGAINELLNNLASKQNKEDSTLATTAKTIVGAIDEVNGKAESKLSKSGDTMTGSLILGTTAETNSPNVTWQDKNRQVWAGITNGAGDWYIWDATNNKAILSSGKSDNVLRTAKMFKTEEGFISNGAWMDFRYGNVNRLSIFANGSTPDADAVFRANVNNAVVESVSGRVIIVGKTACLVKTEENLSVANKAWNTWKPVLASAFTVQSSRLVKENIEDMTDVDAQNILELRPVHFDYKENFGGQKDRSGLIAEEVIDIIPEAVVVPEGYDEANFDESKGLDNQILTIDYSTFVPHLIKLCQIQQEQIDALTKRVEELESKL